MKLYMWARCLVCPVCGAGEHSQCRNVQTGHIMQYHPARLKAGKALRDDMNKEQAA